MRNNPGGLLRAGLDVARLWLDGEAAVFNVQGRDEDGRMAVTQVLGHLGCAAGSQGAVLAYSHSHSPLLSWACDTLLAWPPRGKGAWAELRAPALHVQTGCQP